MATVAERQAERIAFLLAVYEQVDGSERGKANRNEIGARIGLGQDRTIDAFQWCNGLGYLARTDLGGGLGLSHLGIAEAERLIEQGEFVPTAMLVLSDAEYRTIEEFLEIWHRSEGAKALPPDERADADAQLATIEAQSKSPRPRRRIIRSALHELAELGRGLSSNAAFAAAAWALTKLGWL